MTSTPHFLLLSIIFLLLGCQTPPEPNIGLITGGNPQDEEQAWIDFAEQHLNEDIQIISWEAITSDSIDLNNFQLLWFHQIDPQELQEAISAGDKIRGYLENGGRMILGMEAVRLLNAWDIEPEPLQTQTDTITDTGFGRPLGFHAFKDHPLFNKLHGGAYPWKSKEDHVVRKTGFFDKTLPAYPQARVIGTQWTYITFHPDAKLVLEYPVGGGKILAVGAYTYFEPENYNRHELRQFYQNVVDYLNGRLEGPAHYWSYEPRQVKQQELPLPEGPLPAATRWSVPDWSISARTEEPGNSFVDLAGRRMLVMGQEKGGIDEIWTHPFMAARDLRAGLVSNGKVQWLDQTPATLTISPELLLREYQVEGQIIKEYATVSFDQPLALLHYELPEGLEAEGSFFSRPSTAGTCGPMTQGPPKIFCTIMIRAAVRSEWRHKTATFAPYWALAMRLHSKRWGNTKPLNKEKALSLSWWKPKKRNWPPAFILSWKGWAKTWTSSSAAVARAWTPC